LDSDSYLISRATAWLRAAIRDAKLDAQAAREVLDPIYNAPPPADSSARQAHIDSFRPTGIDREEFLARQRDAWREPAGASRTTTASGGRLDVDEVDQLIAAELRAIRNQ
jgi:hypothetical protein